MHCNKIGSFNGIVLVVPNLRQHLFGMSSRFRFSLSRFCGSISKRPNPDVALNHMRDLAVDHLTPKLGCSGLKVSRGAKVLAQPRKVKGGLGSKASQWR